jgi:hypothetical protein
MNNGNTKRTRRNFFLQGGVALGAGVATTAGATALMTAGATTPDPQLRQLQSQLANATDREAIRQLHLAFVRHVGNQAYESAATLFAEDAELHLSGASAAGKRAIERLFGEQYRLQQLPSLHGAYRQNAAQQNDAVTLGDDAREATATFHAEQELCTPFAADCTAAQMARLQGNMASRHWEDGRFDARYVKVEGKWKIASLRWSAGG